jgi:hypothetical protein
MQTHDWLAHAEEIASQCMQYKAVQHGQQDKFSMLYECVQSGILCDIPLTILVLSTLLMLQWLVAAAPLQLLEFKLQNLQSRANETHACN